MNSRLPGILGWRWKLDPWQLVKYTILLVQQPIDELGWTKSHIVAVSGAAFSTANSLRESQGSTLPSHQGFRQQTVSKHPSQIRPRLLRPCLGGNAHLRWIHERTVQATSLLLARNHHHSYWRRILVPRSCRINIGIRWSGGDCCAHDAESIILVHFLRPTRSVEGKSCHWSH
jgi:hypothetical protein